jgi:hypothetical protein
VYKFFAERHTSAAVINMPAASNGRTEHTTIRPERLSIYQAGSPNIVMAEQSGPQNITMSNIQAAPKKSRLLLALNKAAANKANVGTMDPALIRATKRMILRDEAKHLAFSQRAGNGRVLAAMPAALRTQPAIAATEIEYKPKFRHTDALLKDTCTKFPELHANGGQTQVQEIGAPEEPILGFREQFAHDLALLDSAAHEEPHRTPANFENKEQSRKRHMGTSHSRTIEAHKLKGLGQQKQRVKKLLEKKTARADKGFLTRLRLATLKLR